MSMQERLNQNQVERIKGMSLGKQMAFEPVSQALQTIGVEKTPDEILDALDTIPDSVMDQIWAEAVHYARNNS